MPFLAKRALQMSLAHVTENGYGSEITWTGASVYLYNEDLKEAGKTGWKRSKGNKRIGRQLEMCEPCSLF